MTSIETLKKRTDEVGELIRWWLSRSKWRYAAVMNRADSANDFVADVWVRLLEGVKHDIDANLSTVVINACRWELGKYRSKHQRNQLRAAKKAVDVYETDVVEDTLDDIDRCIDAKVLRQVVLSLLTTIDPRRKRIMEGRFGLANCDTKTFEELAREERVSRERIRQLELQSLNQLRVPSRADKLRGFAVDLGLPNTGAEENVALQQRARLRNLDYGNVLLEDVGL